MSRRFSRWLRFVMNQSGITQSALAKDVGVSDSTVCNWYNGYKVPSRKYADAMCKALGVDRKKYVEMGGMSGRG